VCSATIGRGAGRWTTGQRQERYGGQKEHSLRSIAGYNSPAFFREAERRGLDTLCRAAAAHEDRAEPEAQEDIPARNVSVLPHWEKKKETCSHKLDAASVP
jgi:hypothetical protein